jgi:2-phospho-L-lactate transferase/gluconeogenesis factor (CofD/UPF0052 family)
VRLIPENNDPETTATRRLFNYRLPKVYQDAKVEWLAIIEGTHSLWDDISSPRKELLRSYLNFFNFEVVKRERPSSRFDYSGASIGNLFLTGTRLFTGSFEAAIYQLSTICSVPSYISVLPALNTNFAHHIAVTLADGSVIAGQNDISHPSEPAAAVPNMRVGGGGGGHAPGTATVMLNDDLIDAHDLIEDANLPGSLPALRRPAISFSKDREEELPARIERLCYINPYGEEIRIWANPRVTDAVDRCGTVIYSIGSLFTSLIPSLVLRGVGAAIANPAVRNKILILNGTIDRETGPSANPFSGLDFVAAIARACVQSQSGREAEVEPATYSRFVTHVIYLESPTSPKVDKARFAELGIEAMRLYGPKDEAGKGRYDPKGLLQALEAIVGRKDRRDRSRRNTLVG